MLMPAWRGVATLGGTSDLTVISGSMDIKRAVDIIQTVDGNQLPYSLWSGPVASTTCRGGLGCRMK